MKLQSKILIPVVLLILAITGVLSFVYIYFIGGLAVEQFDKNGGSLAANMATIGKIGVLMNDPSQLSKAMDLVAEDKLVQFVGFYDDRGTAVSVTGSLTDTTVLGSMKGIQEPFMMAAHSSTGTSMELFFTPIYSRGKGSTVIGAAVLGISREELVSRQVETAIWSVGMALIFLGAGIVAVKYILRKTVVTPILEVTENIRNGDLNSSFHTTIADEVGDLQRSFDGFVTSIKQTLIQVSEASAAVASASTQISSSTEELAAGAQEQSSQATEVAGAVEEMTKTIMENSQNAGDTANTAKKAKETAEAGGDVVRRTVEGMKGIAGVVNKSAETVRALGKSSDQIGEIISVIDDIADQTNLLALNAAIEAARAGEQGRGFAVVADEVRKLAERTTKATKEIASMIKQIQTDTKEAVVSMEEGTKKVGDGIELADKAGESLQEIVQISQLVTDKVTQIAAASEQQSSASEQISKNVEAISAVTQQSASGTQQIARTAEDLNRLTENLQELLNKFNLGGTEHHVVISKKPSKSMMAKSKKAVSENGHLVNG